MLSPIGGQLGPLSSPNRRFSPLSLNPSLWLKADAGVYANLAKTTPATNGGAVACWADQSGNGNDATQSTLSYEPLFETAVQNGKPVIRFDGSLTRMVTAAFVAALAQPNTIFAVCHCTDLSNYRFVVDGITSAARNSLYYASGTGDASLYCGGPGLVGSALPLTPIVLSAVVNGSSSVVYMNGSSVGTGNPGSNSLTGATVGAQYDGSNQFSGDIAELLIYNSALSDANRVKVENYLLTRWGI